MSHTVLIPVIACGCSALSCWLLSVITREYSWVDRLWSILPPVYVAWFAYCAGFADVRLNLMLLLTVAWGARLTFNFARKGGYRAGGEDYRWAALRQRLGPVKFQLFNATFIAPYQNLLLLLIALPAQVALEHPGRLNFYDFNLAGFFVVLLVGETIADEQQWRFQTAKKARGAEGAASHGFLDQGLFRFSRHPNFFCEMAMWWCIYALGANAMGTILNWGLVGPVLLTLLFHGSANFTEQLSAAKYTQYAEYQRRTSRLVPWGPRAA